MVKKRVKISDKAKPILEGTEEIGIGEKETAVEDLRDIGGVRECVCEGEIDEDGVVDRVRFFSGWIGLVGGCCAGHPELLKYVNCSGSFCCVEFCK